MEDSLPVAATFDPTPPVIPVSVLNRLARERLEAAFPLCWVAGEVSNLSHAASGHVYFSLKDSAAQVRCVMFRNRAQLLGWRLESGQHIEARVLVTLYEARGDFQLNIEAARRAGMGNLYESFLRLKEKLEREGLFASAIKRPLPAFPRRIGVVTSPQAAALRDVLSTLGRRAGQVGIIVYPTPVQGDGAAALIADAIRRAGERAECELLILCRGGGSLEDLRAFNDEAVARAIRACPLPVVSGIGHETDFTIADLAADQRAPTPTAAAELAAPERSALYARLVADRLALQRRAAQLVNQRAQQLDWLARRLQHPGQLLARQQEGLRNLQRRLDAGLLLCSTRARGTLANLGHRLRQQRPAVARQTLHLQSLAPRLERAARRTLDGRAADLGRLAASLSHLDPRAVLARGYSIVTNRQQQIVHAGSMLEPGEEIAVFFHRGRADAAVLTVSADDGRL
ncbi:MAG: Exodeoxyribonuclease 7 large subunit [Accumulibacter sp.]|uniref:exodeoxyribonuclease VII large subunit n=1 Tax=Accumulibacter sp. TaxID=2053492 RepID=UPI00121B770F|nr:exodeoxyribonuclease VII large subunit [Accumulibacter sp.]QKS29101.1 MAG: exodeoxyribonuclease VII large subunit [Candidatus Accumulibacter similis]TLD44954.1 MAG: Exodeoxyribonuclease 7 large subunit [Accumulibacter sp.]